MEAYNSNLSAPQFLKLKEKLDKMAYRESLQHQVHHHNKQRMRRQEEKRMEKSSIDMKYEQEQRKQSVNRYNKISVEREYQVQNYNIYNNNKYRQSQRRNKSNLEIYNNDNPWMKIHANDDRKSKETKDNFRLQNSLNNIQARLKQQLNKKQAERERLNAHNYHKHIENNYNKQVQERQLLKNKYYRTPYSYCELPSINRQKDN